MKSKDVDKKINEGQLIAAQTLIGIMQSNRSSDNAKINASKTLLSRGGYPELRATISKTVSGEDVDLAHLLEKREDLVKRIEESKETLKEAQMALGEADEPGGD